MESKKHNVIYLIYGSICLFNPNKKRVFSKYINKHNYFKCYPIQEFTGSENITGYQFNFCKYSLAVFY